MKSNPRIPIPRKPGPRFAGVVLLANVLLASAPALHAQDIEKSFELLGYQQATDPTVIAPFVTELYYVVFADQTTSQGAPTPNLTVFQGLSASIPVGDEDETVLISGSYNSLGGENGTTTGDTGNIVMNIPTLPDPLDSSNITGFVRRTGTVASIPATPLNGFLAGATGTFTYPANVENRRTTLSLTLADTTSLSGTVNMEVNSEDLLTFNTFDPDVSDFDSLLFAPFSLFRNQNFPDTYIGSFRRIDDQEPDAWFDTRSFIRLIDDADADGDGIPDFSDLQVSYFPFFADMALGGNWYYASWMQSAVYAVAEDWHFTSAMNWLYAPATQNRSEGVWFYSPSDSVEWFWTSARHFPYLYRYSDGAIVYFQKDDNGKGWLYNFENESWEDPAF